MQKQIYTVQKIDSKYSKDWQIDTYTHTHKIILNVNQN